MNLVNTQPRDYLPARRHPETVVGSKKALKPREVWSIRARLQMASATRDLALFNLAIDSKLRSCDLVTLRVSDVAAPPRIRDRAIVIQHKTGRPVQFEITRQTQASLSDWIEKKQLRHDDFLFPSRNRPGTHLSTRQYARILKHWVAGIGLDPADYGTHTMRRTKAAQIYKETGNLRAVQILLGHTKIESTVRYLGIDVDDALEIAERFDL